MVKAVRKHKNRLMVGFNRRFSVQLQDAKAAYEQRTGPAVITYRIATDYRRVWTKVKRRKFQGENFGMMLDELCHIFDLLRWFTGEEPVRIYADGMDYDDTITTIRFTGNVVANIVCSANADIRFPKERLEVFRDRSTIVLDHFLELDDWYYHPPNDKRQWRKHKSYEVAAIYDDRKFGWGMHDFLTVNPARIALHDRVKLRTGSIETVLPGPDKGHLREIEAYGDAILAGRPAPVNEVDGAAATLMGLKAMAAIDRHTVQAVKPSEYFLKKR
jgi:predicted dehydrogenase